MNNVDRHQLIGQALTTLAGGLSPFVTQVLNRVTPPGTDWAELLRAKGAPTAAAAATTGAATSP